MNGIPSSGLIPMLIGLFGITSILELIESIKQNAQVEMSDALKNKQRVRVKLPARHGN